MLGFVGLGVMGEPMCRNLAAKSGQPVLAFDLDPAPVARLAQAGVQGARSVREIAERAQVIFLSLPGGAEVAGVCRGTGGLIAHAKSGACVVDLSTAPVALARELAKEFAARGIEFADAPVARTRQAAQEGTLSVMVGGEVETFKRIRPLIACMASDITHCGAAGAGQAMKIVNNMVLFQNVVALAEALALVRHAGVDAKLALETLSKGSADSFALRNHGMKAMLPGVFPERAFSAEYALKDLSYALELAAGAGIELPGAQNARALLERAIAAGHGAEYFPVLARLYRS
jgi:3-hydroxyisobutyrate dehydrogenase-like beta-hydroxyacid dehydrogenase